MPSPQHINWSSCPSPAWWHFHGTVQQGTTQGNNTFTAQPPWTLTLLKHCSGDTAHPETVIQDTSHLSSTLWFSYSSRGAAQGAVRVWEQRLFAPCTGLPWQHNTACLHTALLGDAPPNIYAELLELLRDWIVYGNHNLMCLCYG